MKHAVTLYNAQAGHTAWIALWQQCKALLLAGHRLHVTVKTETRSVAQNALMWSCLTDISRQVIWHGQKLTPDDWKDMASAAIKRQTVVPGIDGGFVVLGQRTSQMTIAEMSEMVEFLHAFGSQHEVMWSRTSLGRGVPDECAAERGKEFA